MTGQENMRYWRSIQYQEWTEEYRKIVDSEFRQGDSEFTSLQRRDMLKLMGASFALAGLGTACRRPVDNIMPYSKPPEGTMPGVPKYFATTQPSAWGAKGLVVETHEGRPTKIEGNKEHPASRGVASMHEQAAVLELYDPDRSKTPSKPFGDGRAPVTWDNWDAFADDHFRALRKKSGDGLAFLLNAEESPTIDRLRKIISSKYPKANFYVHDPIDYVQSRDGVEKAFGAGARVLYHFDKARVILTLQADPFMQGPDALMNGRGFGMGRKIFKASEASSMNRLYSVEAAYSVTGTNADHRLPLGVAETANFVKALAHELFPERYAAASFANKRFVKSVAKDLRKAHSKALIVPGESLEPELQALVHNLNHALAGQSSVYDVIQGPREDLGSVEKLTADMQKGRINTLVMMGVNPVYSTPASLNFEDALSKVKTTIHVGLYEDESSKNVSWHLPLAHFLESWGDARAYDGTASLIQPMIAPLHGSRSNIELLAQIADLDSHKGLDLVKATWSGISFNRALHDGVISNTAYSVQNRAPKSVSVPEKSKSKGLEILFQPDYKLLDGRYANLSWLQELPDPITKMTWGNAILVSQALALKMGIKSSVHDRLYKADILSVKVGDQSVDMPSFVMPGLADETVVVNLGYGRTKAGYIGNDVGVDSYKILPDLKRRLAEGVLLKRTGKTESLATTQEQFAMNADVIQEINVLSLDKRNPARIRTAEEFGAGMKIKQHKLPQMTKPWPYTGNKWGMVIDLTTCIGCNACVTACQSENNIPVVGKDQVMRSRVMHWIRVDRYFTGDVKNPLSIAQPVPCMHCENAPCEPVCPVSATVHDKEGLNTMIYNRCIGTRYCGNNCPYKVRRFNYLDYTHSGDVYVDPVNKERNVLLQMQKNPNVTVRYRGVMEKCTYCTQRIQEAKIAATREQKDSDDLPDGAVTPACAQTCPTGAITFGNLNDDQSRVSVLKKTDRNYDLLDELNNRPRTSYLAKLRNPNQELV